MTPLQNGNLGETKRSLGIGEYRDINAREGFVDGFIICCI